MNLEGIAKVTQIAAAISSIALARQEAEEEPLDPDERRPPDRPTTTIYIVQRPK